MLKLAVKATDKRDERDVFSVKKYIHKRLTFICVLYPLNIHDHRLYGYSIIFSLVTFILGESKKKQKLINKR